jgi:serine/threonine-protein kinase
MMNCEHRVVRGGKHWRMGETVQLAKGVPTFSRAGEVLSGKYRLEREIGRGAMGTVWAAQHLTLGQRVAIKLIAAEHAQSPDARARFSTEAKAAARLKSRHVVQVYDDGETAEGTPYIVMEYLEGETLESRLERERELPLVDAVRITAQVARGLARAHAQGVVHRDLKPGNIFLARNDEDDLGWTAKVLDFGIAKVEESTTLSTTKTGAVLGTPLFMSPEQVRGASRVDARSDLYSLGICFFNMVSGRFAFDGESFGDILVAICTDPLPELTEAAPNVSPSIGAWFKRCCARLPEDRFQSSDELVERLQEALGGSLVLAQRGAVPEDQRGPSGTLRGHSAPVSTRTPALGTEDSGSFVVRKGAETQSPEDFVELSRSGAAPSVLTVHDAKPRATSAARVVTLIVGSACAVGLVGLVLGLRQPAQSESSTSASPRVSMPATPPTPAPPAPTPPGQVSPLAAEPPVASAAPTPITSPAAPTPSEPALAPAVTPRPRPNAVSPPTRPTSARPARPAPKPKKTSSTDLGF